MNNASYYDVKNYIHNDLGITKEYINDLIRSEVKKQIKTIINDKKSFENLLVKVIQREISLKNNKENINHVFYSVNNAVSSAISKEIKERLSVKLKGTNKEVSIVDNIIDFYNENADNYLPVNQEEYITIYDLLGMIKDNKAPEVIEFNNTIFRFDNITHTYIEDCPYGKDMYELYKLDLLLNCRVKIVEE